MTNETPPGHKPDRAAPGQSLPKPASAPTSMVERMEANARLVAYAQPVMEYLYEQIACPATMVLIADQDGVVLSSVGHAGFHADGRLALPMSEAGRETTFSDTDVIATAIQEQRSVVICGARPDLARNRFLTCLATPILAPGGGVIGLVDLSADIHRDHSHGLALLETAAEMIENRLIPGATEGAMTVRFHPVPEVLGTPLEGLVVFDASGVLLAGNRRAHTLLDLADATPPISHARCFAGGWPLLVELARRASDRPCTLRAASGRKMAAILSARRLLGSQPRLRP